MAEFIATASQDVKSEGAILFSDKTFLGGGSIAHRDGSGIITLRACPYSRSPYTRFKLSFGANAALPIEGIKEEADVKVAIALNGEPLASTTMIVSPTAPDAFFNMNRVMLLEVPSGCCTQISVRNIGDTDIVIQNASLLVEKL